MLDADRNGHIDLLRVACGGARWTASFHQDAWTALAELSVSSQKAGSILGGSAELKAVSLRRRRCTAVAVIDQMHEHGHAGFLSLSERNEPRAADLYGTPVLIDRTPGCHEAETSTKAGTAAARKTDYERKTVAGRVPYLQIHETNDAAELHPASDVGPAGKGQYFANSDNAAPLTQRPVFPKLGMPVGFETGR